MAKYLTLSIPEPCHEKWEGMIPDATGRFCGSCKKSVVDFTGMTDAQLAAFIKKGNENTCGRFNTDQLNRDIIIPGKPIPWLKYFFTITIPAVLYSSEVSAQVKEKENTVFYPAIPNNADSTFATETFSHRILTGTVTDNEGRAVEAANVVIVGTRKGTTTDQYGNFKLNVINEKQIQISSVNIVGKTVDIPSTGNLNIQVSVTKAELSGLMVVTVRSLGKKTGKKKASYEKKLMQDSLSTINSINVYPNPASANTDLHISWKNMLTAEQFIEIFSADGHLMQSSTLNSFAKTNTTAVYLKELPVGFYILRVTDLKSHQKLSKEFIVK